MEDLYFNQFVFNEDPVFSVIIEDMGKVTYAYLLEKNNIVSDLWLCNNHSAPKYVDWKDKKSMPFMNPQEYIDPEKSINVINNKSDIKIGWSVLENSAIKIQAMIYIDKELIGVLRYGTKPGWSTLVKRDSPLANKFDEKLLNITTISLP
jgi:hypothetical protein